MSTPPSDFATGLGATRKVCPVRTGRLQRDLDDAGEVFLLAHEIATGDARRASLLSLDEIRAIARLAVAMSEATVECLSREPEPCCARS